MCGAGDCPFASPRCGGDAKQNDRTGWKLTLASNSRVLSGRLAEGRQFFVRVFLAAPGRQPTEGRTEVKMKYDDMIRAADAAQVIIQAHVPEDAVVEPYLEDATAVGSELRVSITIGGDLYWVVYGLRELVTRSAQNDGFSDFVVAAIPLAARR